MREEVKVLKHHAQFFSYLIYVYVRDIYPLSVDIYPVSYTHLDVYKRQELDIPINSNLIARLIFHLC